MKSAVETLEPTKVKMTVEVDYDELRPSIDHAYKHIAEEVNIPGFRRGKVPPRIIDQRIGRVAVLEHAVNDGLSGFYRQAVDESNLRPIGKPEIEVTEVPIAAEGPLKFTVEVEVRPEIVLPEFEDVALTVDAYEVTDEDVTERLDALRERFGTLVGVDRPAAEGDFVVIDLKASVDDEEVDSVAGISYQIGSGNMLDGLDEALTGLSAEESTTFETKLAGGEHEGKDAQVTVTATGVKRRDLPDADDDFAQLASEFDTLDELKADLREQVESAKQTAQAIEARDALLKHIMDTVEVPVPAGVVEAEVHRHLENEDRLEDDEHRAEVTQDTTNAVRNQMVLDTLAEKMQTQVSQPELIQYLINISRQYGMDPNQFVQTLDSNGQIPAMIAEVARSKSLAEALRQVKVTDSAGEVVDLDEFLTTENEPKTAADALIQALVEEESGSIEAQTAVIAQGVTEDEDALAENLSDPAALPDAAAIPGMDSADSFDVVIEDEDTKKA